MMAWEDSNINQWEAKYESDADVTQKTRKYLTSMSYTCLEVYSDVQAAASWGP